MMARTLRVALVGDFNPSVVAHRAIPMALNLAARQQGVEVQPLWAHTSSILRVVDTQFASFDGIWCVPASPYANTLGALAVIRYARETGPAIPRHVRRVSARTARVRAERVRNGGGGACGDGSRRAAATDRAACLLAGGTQRRDPAGGGWTVSPRLRAGARSPRATTAVTGSTGSTNRASFATVLRATAHDRNGEVRGVELAGHPFFVAALFQPERRALTGEVPPLVAAFVAAMAA